MLQIAWVNETAAVVLYRLKGSCYFRFAQVVPVLEQCDSCSGSSGTVTGLCSSCTDCGPAQVAGDNSCAGVLVRFSPVWLGRIHLVEFYYSRIHLCSLPISGMLSYPESIAFIISPRCFVGSYWCWLPRQGANCWQWLGPISGLVDIPVYFTEG